MNTQFIFQFGLLLTLPLLVVVDGKYDHIGLFKFLELDFTT
jgi:hypothetical protein